MGLKKKQAVRKDWIIAKNSNNYCSNACACALTLNVYASVCGWGVDLRGGRVSFAHTPAEMAAFLLAMTPERERERDREIKRDVLESESM